MIAAGVSSRFLKVSLRPLPDLDSMLKVANELSVFHTYLFLSVPSAVWWKPSMIAFHPQLLFKVLAEKISNMSSVICDRLSGMVLEETLFALLGSPFL